jgi:L-threonylcarbamoyladenylate synthase
MKEATPEEAAELLREGGVVIVPTETVVGLLSAGAGQLNEIKGSDPGKPITLLCASAEEAFDLAADVPPLAKKLAESLWPGPLTLVLDRDGGGSVGVRVPAGAVTGVLEAYGAPLYATSANPTGRPAPNSLGGVDPEVLDAADAVVPGEAGSGEASAVVDFSDGRVRLLRPTAKLSEGVLSRLAGEEAGSDRA